MVGASCGGESAAPEATTEAQAAGVPAELLGTYTTTLEQADIPASAPPELGELEWTLRIGDTGGPDDGPFLAIDSPTHGNLEAPGLRVEGDHSSSSMRSAPPAEPSSSTTTCTPGGWTGPS